MGIIDIDTLEYARLNWSEKAMSLAELLREEGMKRGIEVGLEKGETKAPARTVIKFLVRRFDSENAHK